MVRGLVVGAEIVFRGLRRTSGLGGPWLRSNWGLGGEGASAIEIIVNIWSLVISVIKKVGQSLNGCSKKIAIFFHSTKIKKKTLLLVKKTNLVNISYL